MNDRTYPHQDGDVTVIGPECISSTRKPTPATVINWQGVNYVEQVIGGPQDDLTDSETGEQFAAPRIVPMRPGPGVILTPEEAGIAARGIREWLHQLDRYSPTLEYGPAAFRDNATALADRLEKVAGR